MDCLVGSLEEVSHLAILIRCYNVVADDAAKASFRFFSFE